MKKLFRGGFRLRSKNLIKSSSIQNYARNLNQKTRFFMLIFADTVLIIFSIWFSFYLQTGLTFSKYFLSSIWSIPVALSVGISIYIFTNQYKSLTRSFSSFYLFKIVLRNFYLVTILSIFEEFSNVNTININTWITIWIILTSLECLLRVIIRDSIFKIIKPKNTSQPKVCIYGAGEAGAQLAKAIAIEKSHDIKAFIDDSKDLWGLELNGISIKSPDYLDENRDDIEQILLALPSISKYKNMQKAKTLTEKGFKVLQIPSLATIASGKLSISNLRSVAIEEILGREIVEADSELISSSILNSVVFITGAGGSIGAELCKKIIFQKPSHLILLEISEPSLYQIINTLEEIKINDLKITYILGSANDKILMKNIFKKYNLDLIFHAAAYKHVPIVENNPIEGISNNIISTRIICEEAEKNGVKKVILISTDKAVRPTNVMGCSKRLAELIFSSFSVKGSRKEIKKNISNTKFIIVRFGNVLESSGSVIPLFKKQISKGGPVTVTDKKIIRYFMTKSEAAELVIQAAFIAQDGDICLLEMGNPVKIFDLAKQMIQLSGLSIKDKNNPEGDIEIVTTGLRPGEKLYEELLIDGSCKKTIHPLIYTANEKFILRDELIPSLDKLEKFLKDKDHLNSLKLISKIIPEWKVDKIHEI